MSDDEANIKIHDDGDGEEEAQDWTTLNKQFAALKVHDESLPKRSDKEFDLDGSTVQRSNLETSRGHMYQALDHIRGHHTKQLLVGVWLPEKGKTLVPHAKGGSFKNMGTAHVFRNKKRLQGMWLSPIETVYLTERGSLIMYMASDPFMNFIEDEEQEFPFESLPQLSLSYMYALAFGLDDSLIDKYQVYAMLKRLGYIVMEFQKYSPQYESLEAIQQAPLRVSKLQDWLVSLGFFTLSTAKYLNHTTLHYFSYTLLFKSLQFIPSYSAYESLLNPPIADPRYGLVFNVWKPTPAFSKKNPPMPEFQVSVVNIAKVPFPSLASIQGLFNELNFDLKVTNKANKTQAEKDEKQKKTQKLKTPPPPTKRELKLKRKLEREAKIDPRILKRNNYLKLRDLKLKAGSTGRSVVLASIDNGIISFNTLNETEFKLSTQRGIEDLNAIYPKPSHGTVWNEPFKL